MTRDAERQARAGEAPIVDGLPDVPGILVAMRLAEGLGRHLRGLADALLVDAFPGSSLTRGERELLATAVSAGNDCFYCMDTHGAFAAELLRRNEVPAVSDLIDSIKNGETKRLDPRMAALTVIARQVGRSARHLRREEIDAAKSAGASDGDIQLAVLIAAAFCMYNRMVDGMRAQTPANPRAYEDRARQIADYGYADARTSSIPR
jgi:uncharacterized peroxidase-related enzyme